MDIRKVREEIRMGKSIYDLPLRVTFYARVSTDLDEQINSLDNQIQFYTELIQSRPQWKYVHGYVDEGISGTSTKKRADFNRMIKDAKEGLFDFIITKEISRFSRSTLDSIHYTQELLEHNVGILFQNDNINTLDTDSELRLVIMAGVAQDEVRKLSERLKFGFRQAIRNGHVLGNDRLYGYDKKNCVLSIKEDEAEIIRLIFDLYANERIGTRAISNRLLDLGITSREGNAFNVLTIRHILTNPKYKGWYCGNKTKSVDYRTKKKAFLDEAEWVMYPDPSIPPIVSEDLWDRANSLYKKRREEVVSHSGGESYHNRYPYSTKIICEEHGTSFFRQLLKSSSGTKEVWECKVYRNRGRAACSAPQIRSKELDMVMGYIFRDQKVNRQVAIETILGALMESTVQPTLRMKRNPIQEQVLEIGRRKDHLLDLSYAGAISLDEFKERNDALTHKLKVLKEHLASDNGSELTTVDRIDVGQVQEKLEHALNDIPLASGLGAAILKNVLVKRDSSPQAIHLIITLKNELKYEVVYKRNFGAIEILSFEKLIESVNRKDDP